MHESLAKHDLILLELTTAAAGIHQKALVVGTSTLVFSIKEIEDVKKIFKSLEKSGLLTKGNSETNSNEAKEQNNRFPDMFLGTADASFLRHLLASKGVFCSGEVSARIGYNF